MSTASTNSPTAVPFKLDAQFAREFPELSSPGQGEDAPAPSLLLLNEELAQELGLDPEWLKSDDGINFLLGRDTEPLSQAVSQAYAGHQFGQFVPQLGDGRALLLGEVQDKNGMWRDIHLKGSGRTKFSRGGDGRAALGPVLREYLVSEAMFALGVPTTRALAVLTTGRKIQRETAVPGAVLVRVAASHIRVGSFQYSNLTGGIELSKRLADFSIKRNYPELASSLAEPTPQLYVDFFRAVMKRQARTVAQWTRLGFVHGVLNTDNTLISGETIDYGPCAFMETYSEDTFFSSIDTQGRYSFGNQPSIIGWNLARLVETLLPLLAETPDEAMTQAQILMNEFGGLYREALQAELALALGVDASEKKLFEDFQNLLALHSPDLTTLMRALTEGTTKPSGFEDWVARWQALNPNLKQMAQVNPIFIPRNHLVEDALSSALNGDLHNYLRLLKAVTHPFDREAGTAYLSLPSSPGFEDNYRTFCGT
ncbi:YdiU family protein [Corynebacterium callunae]|uniref:protein adenylyltransferase SelO n=1 Tax=Corynebacterium callunae TaxID=1721 RepID=UPI003981FD31